MRKEALCLLNPILVAIFPVLFLYSENLHLVQPIETIKPLLIGISVGLGVYLLPRLLFINKEQASAYACVLLLFFFSYSNIYYLAQSIVADIRHRFVLLPWLFVVFISLLLVTAFRKKIEKFNGFLRTAFTFLILFQFYQIYSKNNLNNKLPNQKMLSYLTAQEIKLDQNSNKIISKPKRDMYLLILDGYTGQKALKEYYNFNNKQFYLELANRNFSTNQKSFCNYPHTIYSLTSTLNLRYVDSAVVGSVIKDYPNLINQLNHNFVFKFLKKQGYQIEFISPNEWPTNHVQTADKVLLTSKDKEDFFYRSYINTAFSLLTMHGVNLGNQENIRFTDKYIKNRLTSVPTAFKLTAAKNDSQKPIFRFVHILSPHDPATFKPDGSPQEKNIPERQGYLDDLKYINKKTIECIDQILENYKNKLQPIILIQSDHGWELKHWKPRFDDRYKQCRGNIINLSYLPGLENKKNIQELTPVNTFRFIFNEYFNTDFKYLKNKIYHVNFEKRGKLEDITEFIYGNWKNTKVHGN